jgi:Agenet domain
VYHPGRIVAIHDEGTYDVRAKGIEIQRNVTTANLYRVDDSLVMGAVIEAKFQGVGDAWYRGKIVRLNDDGSFDVEYDDGDKEYAVAAEHIRFSL